MSDLKPQSRKIMLGKNQYGMRFTVNTIDDIQEKFDISIQSIQDLFTDERHQMRNLRFLLTLLINEGIDCDNDETGEKRQHVDERYVGRHITLTNMKPIMEAVYATCKESTPEGEDEDPNVKTA